MKRIWRVARSAAGNPSAWARSGKETEPLVQVALIDLLVDLKEAEAAPALRGLAVNPAVDAGVRQRANWASRDCDEMREHRTFSGVRELIVDNVNGFIEVTGSSGGAVEVEISKTVNAESSDRAALAKKEVKLDVAQEGGLVRLMVDGPFRNHGDMGYRVTYDFTIKAPRDIKLDLRTVGTRNDRSHITVRGTSGDFKIGSVNGGIEMRDVEARAPYTR